MQIMSGHLKFCLQFFFHAQMIVIGNFTNFKVFWIYYYWHKVKHIYWTKLIMQLGIGSISI